VCAWCLEVEAVKVQRWKDIGDEFGLVAWEVWDLDVFLKWMDGLNLVSQ
jgi:hypothetical protein